MFVHQSGWFSEPLGHSENTEKNDKYAQGDIFLNRLRTIPPSPKMMSGGEQKKFFLKTKNILLEHLKIF